MAAVKKSDSRIAYFMDFRLDRGLFFLPNDLVLRGMNEAARREGVWIDYYDSSFDMRNWCDGRHYRDYLGLIFTVPDHLTRRAEYVHRLEKKMPTVHCMISSPGSSTYVGVDDAGGMELVVAHLADEGISRIGFVSFNRLAYSLARQKGFLSAMNRRDLACPPDWHYHYPLADSVTNDHRVEYPGRIRDAAERCARAIVLQKNRPDALVCTNDQFANSLAKSLTKKGLRIPHDLALTGFNDEGAYNDEYTFLTSVNQDYRRIGAESVSVLMKKVRSPKKKLSRYLLVPPKLSVRRSSLRNSLGLGHHEAFRERAYEYLRTYYLDGKAMRRMHEVFGISRHYFSQRFKDVFGKSTLEMTNELRLANAAELLKFSRKSITEICFQCGFGTYQHFHSKFIERYRLAPTAFRNT